MKKTYDVLVIGPVSLDHNIDYQGNERKEVGGAVVASGFAAAKSGNRTAVFTKLNPADADVEERFAGSGADVYWKPSQATCSIRNQYFTADKEKRACTSMGVCDPFRFDELPDIETKIYHFAGLVYGDFDGALFAEAARHGKVAVDVQCLLRHVEADRTMAFHDYLYTYYDRNLSHPNMGYEYYGIGNGLELEEVFPPSDLEMMEEIVPRFVDEDHFMVYCLTVSGHLNYNREGNVMSDRHYDEVAGLPYSEGVKCYLACQQELELAMESLVRQLEEAGRLEDTVIVLSADHYPYGLTDEEYSELFGHPVDPVFEIYENSLILWSADLEEPVHVDKYCSSLDVMPTLANLFGLEYDSRLMAGRDILSDTPGLVIFSNYSFLTDLGAYNSTTAVFTMWDGSEPDPDYVAERVAEVQNRVAYSASILDNDYYRVVFGDPED